MSGPICSSRHHGYERPARSGSGRQPRRTHHVHHPQHTQQTKTISCRSVGGLTSRRYLFDSEFSLRYLNQERRWFAGWRCILIARWLSGGTTLRPAGSSGSAQSSIFASVREYLTRSDGVGFFGWASMFGPFSAGSFGEGDGDVAMIPRLRGSLPEEPIPDAPSDRRGHAHAVGGRHRRVGSSRHRAGRECLAIPTSSLRIGRSAPVAVGGRS